MIKNEDKKPDELGVSELYSGSLKFVKALVFIIVIAGLAFLGLAAGAYGGVILLILLPVSYETRYALQTIFILSGSLGGLIFGCLVAPRVFRWFYRR